MASLVDHLLHALCDVDLPNVKRLFVGFSGGADSTALLRAAVGLRAVRDDLEVIALHIDHGLSPSAPRWAAHCQSIGQALQVQVRVDEVHLPASGNLEANARQARYEVFTSYLQQPGDVLVLAHHREDQVETVLLRLLQGRGTTPMRKCRRLGGGWLVRPFLDLARDELRASLDGLAWVEDASNLDTRLARNFLRHEVVPAITAFWPQADLAICQVAESQQANQRSLVRLAQRLGDRFALAHLDGPQDEAIALLRAYLQGRGVFQASQAMLQEFLTQLDRGDHARLDLTEGALRCHASSVFWVAPPDPEWSAKASLGEWVDFGLGALRLCDAGDRAAGWLEPAVKHAEVQLSDNGHTVAQQLKGWRIPPWWRDQWPIFVSALGPEWMPEPSQSVPARLADRLELRWHAPDKNKPLD